MRKQNYSRVSKCCISSDFYYCESKNVSTQFKDWSVDSVQHKVAFTSKGFTSHFHKIRRHHYHLKLPSLKEEQTGETNDTSSSVLISSVLDDLRGVLCHVELLNELLSQHAICQRETQIQQQHCSGGISWRRC